MEAEDSTGVERRSFLRKAALTGLATAWATPIVQTVDVALAHGDQTPRPPGTTTDETPSTPETPGDSGDTSDDD